MFWDKWFEPKPFNSGFLPEKDGHKVYFAEFGNPNGKPVLVFNGGPGGSFHPYRAKYANLRKYRVIMFDQRGCGRSEPSGKVGNNTTQDLLNDTTRLVNHLKINQKIILWGASWGSTLALLWAEQNPEKTDSLLLSQFFLANKEHRDWEFDGLGHIYPEFVAEMTRKSKGNIIGYNNKLIQSDNIDNQLYAVNHYGWYERICGSQAPSFADFKELPADELASQRIYMHYAAHNFFLSDDDILDNISKISGIKTLILHSRLDLVCPVKAAYDLQQKLDNARLIVLPAFGHVNPLMRKAIKKEIGEILK